MNILLLASHSIAEFDDIRMFTDLGYDVFCPGGYQNPRESGEGLRPGIPNAPVFPDLIAASEAKRAERGDPGQFIDWAKADIPETVLDWADVIICHHFPEQWLAAQWNRIREKRVIWRTCGQSNPYLEQVMRELRLDGLQIVRYSPAERRYFEPLGVFAGEDAVIRFGKYPEDYGPWNGGVRAVGNVTQHMAQRGDACGYGFWREATGGLPTWPAGPGSESLGGAGTLTYPGMLRYLRDIRVYLYTGTRPASYTLGLIEAMMTGTPVVSIPPQFFEPERLFEGAEIAGTYAGVDDGYVRTPEKLIETTRSLLTDRLNFDFDPSWTTHRAKSYFDVAHVGPQWVEFLS